MAPAWTERQAFPSVLAQVRIAQGDWNQNTIRLVEFDNDSKMALDQCISYLDENFAKVPDNTDTRDVQKAIEEAVSALLVNVAANDARFECKLEPSGSFYESKEQKLCRLTSSIIW